MQATGINTTNKKHITFATMIVQKMKVNTKEAERCYLIFFLPGYPLCSSFALSFHHFHEAFAFVLRNKCPSFNRKC